MINLTTLTSNQTLTAMIAETMKRDLSEIRKQLPVRFMEMKIVDHDCVQRPTNIYGVEFSIPTPFLINGSFSEHNIDLRSITISLAYIRRTIRELKITSYEDIKTLILIGCVSIVSIEQDASEIHLRQMTADEEHKVTSEEAISCTKSVDWFKVCDIIKHNNLLEEGIGLYDRLLGNYYNLDKIKKQDVYRKHEAILVI